MYEWFFNTTATMKNLFLKWWRSYWFSTTQEQLYNNIAMDKNCFPQFWNDIEHRKVFSTISFHLFKVCFKYHHLLFIPLEDGPSYGWITKIKKPSDKIIITFLRSLNPITLGPQQPMGKNEAVFKPTQIAFFFPEKWRKRGFPWNISYTILSGDQVTNWAGWKIPDFLPGIYFFKIIGGCSNGQIFVDP